MLRFMASRLLTVVPMLLILTVIVFLLVEIAPGDPAAIIAGADASPEAIEAVRQRLGLDQPVCMITGDHAITAPPSRCGSSTCPTCGTRCRATSEHRSRRTNPLRK
ncbi:hypothetical protein [Rhodococcus rhodochrous]|uniref:hypothetical protein n=1 Tax=Rhodococcus rhodochrous TaxID=1829 RepID=UPI0036F27B93